MVTKLKQLQDATKEKTTTTCPAGAHNWVLRPPAGAVSTADKITAAETSASLGTQFEAAAAKHNKVTNSQNLSGDKGTPEEMKWVCSVAGCPMQQGREGDHTLDDPSGKPTIVEAKAKRAMEPRDARQLARNMATVASGNAAGVVMKVPKGAGWNVLVSQIKKVASHVGGVVVKIIRVKFP